MTTTYRSTKEIAALIRNELKVKLPEWRFSVSMKSFSMGSSITVALMSGPEQAFEPWPEDTNGFAWKMDIPGYAQLNQYQFRTNNDDRMTNGYYLTPAVWDVMTQVNAIVQKYHWDKSDIQSDYYACNFYYHLEIGKWNKGYEVKK